MVDKNLVFGLRTCVNLPISCPTEVLWRIVSQDGIWCEVEDRPRSQAAFVAWLNDNAVELLEVYRLLAIVDDRTDEVRLSWTTSIDPLEAPLDPREERRKEVKQLAAAFMRGLRKGLTA